MKIRIMLKRIVQPPIETQAGVDYHSFIFDVVDQTTLNFLTGADCRGCGVSIDVIGVEINPE
uniref:Uncharacterized protein n=1 Tax=viral metagenome TaxID=1070528 RepID=A0A6M3IQT5_9ZZZZ